MLNLLLNNKNTMLKNIEEIRINNSTQEKMMFFDSITLYFESLTRDGLRRPGYSKDGKFKEVQIVVGMACDINGIPIFIKYFPETQVMLKHRFRF
ncbi:hypothetical protein RRG55_02735 [Mycoplasmopsis felis]|uniref:hypothetical protein n=1 Tax=Mycoplasmopsis felis TaxID=33923 RepID=UPI002AFEA78F|nr:hypothetical protein [Mycoplasmopsis felis]WQQ04187.1 hypothetical protein RRG47_01270 [Mycoplasmopsis felis]